MIRSHKSGFNLIQSFDNHPLVRQFQYFEQFSRVRAAIKFSLVLTAEEGSCLPLPLALPSPPGQQVIAQIDVPSDLSEIFSPKFPDELYFHLSKGLISPQLLGWLSTGLILETMPYDNGESAEYMKYIKEVITENFTAPRCTALGLLASCLNPAWATRRVVSLVIGLSRSQRDATGDVTTR